MKKQIRLFYGDLYGIESEINDWLTENNDHIKDIQISMTNSNEDEYVACVYFIWQDSQE